MQEFDAIFRNHYRPLYLYALKFIGNDDDAHNIVQDIFMAVFEKKLYHKKDDHLKSYLFNAVRNSCFNYLKHQKAVNRHASTAIIELKEAELRFFENSEKSLIERETFEKIHDAIRKLPEEQRMVIILSRFEGLRNREIAEKLNVPVRTVETRIYRALENLRKKLTSHTFFILLNYLRPEHFQENMPEIS
jgi:RNA polymerase sigma-70 factor (ECF subfamily)